MFEKFPLIYAFNKGGTGGGGGCSSIDIENSDLTYQESITCAQSPFTLPDIILTQPNGSTESKPSVINLMCTQIPALADSDLIAQLLSSQIVSVYNSRISINVRQYTANDTWVKPSNLLFAHIICIGGGAGGSSGAKRPAGTASGGGGGGGAGALARRIMSASEIGASESIIIGAGGVGGAPVTTDNTAQNLGTNGGNTSFGTHVIAAGGRASTGTNTRGEITPFNISTPSNSRINIQGGAGGNGGASGAGVAGTVMTTSSPLLSYGGGGGSAISAASPGTQNVGGAGSRIFNEAGILSSVIAGGTSGGGNGNNGVDNWALHIGLLETTLNTIGYGSSGSGGGSANDGITYGGNGGNGGLYGGGGGGGGACRNGTAQSGAGGNGAQGCLIIYEFLIV